MSWQTDATTMLRALVGDLGTTQTYSDANLQKVLAVAAFQVSLEMDFGTPFVVSVPLGTVTPDPTDTTDPTYGVGSDSFVNLSCLKAACMLDRGEARVAAQQGIMVKDNQSSVDLRGIADAKVKLLQKGGYCVAYADAKFEYMAGQSRVAGAAVMTPFRVYASCGGFYGQVPGHGRDFYW